MANEKRRLIDANALRDDTFILDSWDAKIVRAWLDDQPTVDAVEVVHGRWVKKTSDCVYYYACSECGEPVLRSQWGNDFFSNYCPNCGAKMDGDGNG